MPLVYKKEIQPTEIHTPDGFVCDKCKKKFTEEDIVDCQEYITIEHYCGYGSVFGDGNVIFLTICQTCAKEMLGDLV